MGYVSEPNIRKWLNTVKWFRVLLRMVHHLNNSSLKEESSEDKKGLLHSNKHFYIQYKYAKISVFLGG